MSKVGQRNAPSAKSVGHKVGAGTPKNKTPVISGRGSSSSKKPVRNTVVKAPASTDAEEKIQVPHIVHVYNTAQELQVNTTTLCL